MQRPLLTLAVLAVLTFARPAPAAAGFWAWLEEWSGPGPFNGWTFLFTGCVQERALRPSPIALQDKFHQDRVELARKLAPEPGRHRVILKRILANPEFSMQVELTRAGVPSSAAPPDLLNVYTLDAAEHGPGHTDKRPICGYFDQGFFSSRADVARGFEAIDAHLTDIGSSARLHDGVDVGGGFGWVTFTGDGMPTKRRATLTPLRVVLRPVLLAVPEHRRSAWMGVVNIYWKETFVVGRLNAADFGSSTDTFSVDGELIRSFGLNFDLTALFPTKWRY